ncbi:hypothetical protein MAPG_01197 [Magnaporthiopsis poae ATCC 64411]|uniref:Rhodopsin domain-containing protein n=1 Tax=Magnaporthiopsis poae (strain ATCC 64411 / 73-15) TaxID=644358 RepID=A0A0C4DN24_MAGP6|nr:hypothetical protein MAPG_01197 [Magnaporthiopsis poae ATCC 64411]
MRPILLGIIGWFAGFTSVFVIGRLATKVTRLSQWGPDDTAIVIVWIMFTCLLPTGILAIRRGFALDMWSIPSRTITRFLFYFFILEPCYVAMIFLVKTSILFTYMRIFQNPRARKLFHATHTFNLIQAVLFIILVFFQCRPINHFWLGWTGRSGGRCYNLSVLPVSHAAVGVLLDLWMILLPAAEVLALKLKPRDTVAVLLMFGCGVLLTVISCLRIPYLLTFARPSNLTIGSLQTGIWTYSEIAVGIMVACMPNLRQLVAQLLLPKLRSTPSLKRRTISGPRFTLRSRTAADGGAGTDKGQLQRVVACRGGSLGGKSSENLKLDSKLGDTVEKENGSQWPLTSTSVYNREARLADEGKPPTPFASHLVGSGDGFGGGNTNSDVELRSVQNDASSGTRQKASWQSWD